MAAPDTDFFLSYLRDLKLDLDEMIGRPNTRTPDNLRECKRIVLLIEKRVREVADEEAV